MFFLETHVEVVPHKDGHIYHITLLQIT